MHLLYILAIPLTAVLAHALPSQKQQQQQQHHLSAETYLAIDKVLNAFSFAVDARPVDPTAFSQIFAPNAWMNLQQESSPQIGIESITAAFVDLLPKYRTQHSFGTKSIVLNADGTASCETVFVGTFWGTADKAFDYLQNYPRYFDRLALNDEGEWRITNKTLQYMTPSLGNLTIT